MKLMKHGTGGELVEVVAEHGDEVWVKSFPDDKSGCWTGSKRYYEPVHMTPEVGDIWWYGHATEFIVLGVDEKRKQYHMVRKDALSNQNPGGPLIRPDLDSERTQNIGRAVLYTRLLPEERMELKERPA